jgi:heterodisulfide reductase subunit B
MPLVRDILRQARDRDADAIVTICPLCHLNLEAHQRLASKQEGSELRTPIIYFSQAMGLALGLEPSAMRLDKLLVPPDVDVWGNGQKAA